jgi:hypothetical protein
MKHRILLLGIAGISLASAAAFADIQVSVNPFGYWGPSPPIVYAPPRYYAPPAVYAGRGHWGERDYRGHRDDHGRSDHHDGGDGRH